MKKWLLLTLGLFLSFPIYSEPLPVADAFQLEVKKLTPNTFSLNWTIKSGYFLYSDRIKLTPETSSNFNLGSLRLPPTQVKKDKQGHSYTVYRGQLALPVDVLGLSPGESLVQLKYQGCSDDGFCYPPETKEIKIGIDEQLALATVNLEEEKPIINAPEGSSQSDKISQVFTEHNSFMVLVIFYGFGLLLSFTPCILPMVPVLSGIIVGHGRQVTTRKAFFLSLSYVLSMSITYAVLGAIVAVVGENLQISMQSPWAISIFSLIFILLALSMFGFYELKLPDSWQAKIAGSSRGQRGGHYLGAAIMGCLSTLILSPCVTAPLIGALTYIAQSHNMLLGSLTLFVLSLGMGTPLLLIGTSAGKLLPESGSWMNAIKAFFGILLLGVAIYLMARILPTSLTMFCWACLLIFSGIYAGALIPAQTHREKGKQGIGIILFIYGLLILIGASMGANDPLQPLVILKNSSIQEHATKPTRPQTLVTVEQAIHEAKGTPVLLDFYADWCSSCKIMEATTFQDPEVKKLLANFKFIRIDVTQNNAADKALMRHFKVIAPPSFLFFDKQGKGLNQFKVVGEVSTAQFIKVLQEAK
ncbi:protein-disulfide reductase DsbD [Legionella sp. km772]|uniref:protein-disulfide reductase DsbD n=1 Tax=Legionella sp. km772 TaxID=2498111 RepID=UPI000F8C5C89|nr:protein-disulfide reductase DsbD [Legionella sp. km772]RUR06588.1 protein-disulfide reductase DsbD [Legionella sp. km772]